MKLSALVQDYWADLSSAVIQSLSKLYLDYWENHDRTVIAVVAFAAGFVVGYRRASPTRSYQHRAEAKVSEVLRRYFAPPNYHLMNHVTLKFGDSTTQVDHILVSRFGVFVIETKDYSGWLFASSKQAKWTQVLFQKKFRFQNPVLQNALHVRAVEDVLDILPAGAVKSVVVFAGDAEFKTPVPQGVFSVSGLIEYLCDQTEEVMSLNRVQFCVGRLETARLGISKETDVEHLQNVQRRHGRTS